MLIPVILSGGSGTRLWPVSREAFPKPFMKLGGELSLLQRTLSRCLPAADGKRVAIVERTGEGDNADAHWLVRHAD